MLSVPLGDDEAVLGQQPPDLVRLRGARLDEALAGAVQGQHRLLPGVLDRHEAHVGTPHGLANRLGVRRVVLVRLHVRLHELRGHQPDRVPQLAELLGPVMRAAAGFHADQARRQVGEERQQLRPFDLFLQGRLAPFIDAMHLENAFCQIDPNCCNVHFGRLFFVELNETPLWHFRCRLGRGRPSH